MFGRSSVFRPTVTVCVSTFVFIGLLRLTVGPKACCASEGALLYRPKIVKRLLKLWSIRILVASSVAGCERVPVRGATPLGFWPEEGQAGSVDGLHGTMLSGPGGTGYAFK